MKYAKCKICHKRVGKHVEGANVYHEKCLMKATKHVRDDIKKEQEEYEKNGRGKIICSSTI